MLLLAVLNFGPTERALTRAVSDILSEKLGSEAKIGKVEVGLFNRVLLHDVCLKDLQGRNLLTARLMTAKIELRSLLPGRRVALRSVSALDASIRLIKPSPDGDTNFQFIIDAFSNKKKKNPSKIDFRINSLILRRVNVSYDELFAPQTYGRLNTSHIDASDINANISLKHISRDDLSMRVRTLSLKEKSGLCLKNLTLKLRATREQALIEDLDLRLPHSHISQKEINATYDARDGMKNLGKTLCLKGNLKNATIATMDLRPILPMKNAPDLQLRIGCDYEISPDISRISNLSISEKRLNFSMEADADMRRTNGKTDNITVHIGSMSVGNEFATHLASTFVSDTSTVRAISRLGNSELTAHLFYVPGVKATGKTSIKTQAGNLEASGTWRLSENRVTTRFYIQEARPAHITAKKELPSLVTAQGEANLTISQKTIASASCDMKINSLEWKECQLGNMSLSCNYSSGRVKAKAISHDPVANLQAETLVSLQGNELSSVSLQAQISHFEPFTFYRSKLFGQASFSGNITADLSRSANGGLLPHGTVAVRDFKMSGSPRGDYFLDKLDLSVTGQGENELLTLASDFADVKISGPLHHEELIAAVSRIAQRSLPGLWRQKEGRNRNYSQANSSWNIDASIKRTDFFEKMTGMSLSLESPFNVKGFVDGGNGRSSLTASTEGFSLSGQKFGRTSLYLNGKGTEYQCLFKTQKPLGGKNFDLIANLNTRDSTLFSKIDWKSHTLPRYEGQFESATRFDIDRHKNNDNTTALAMHIHPTKFVLADSVWNIAAGFLSLEGRELTIDKFEVSHASQSLIASGHIAPSKNDSIVAQLKDIDVDYILSLVDFHAVDFGGRATGTAFFTQKGGFPEVSATLRIPDMTFNQGKMGKADITGSWSKNDNCIRLDADMKLPNHNGESAGTKVKGHVDLTQKGLSLNITAKQTNLQFLRRYVDGIFDHFDGEATGNIRLNGPFKKLDFEGLVDANARARIISTGVFYNVSNGYVEFAPGLFSFHNFNVTDDRNGKGSVSGEMRHTHLKNLNYDFTLTADHLLCYDQPQSPGLPFYSTTTGTGSMRLSGQPGLFTADINLRPNAPTTLIYIMGSDNPLSANDTMVRLHSSTDTSQIESAFRLLGTEGKDENTQISTQTESTTDIWLNFLIDANPSAQVKIITDPRAGDAITAYGDGTIRATWHNKGAFEMYGTYTLSRGTYKLSLQDVIRKDLTLEPGSTLTFSGNPLEADLGLKAKYTVNGASLSDLNYGAGFSQKSVKVDCILNIGGKAKNPQVDFDLDLQGISEDEKQMVRQLIATDEDMNRQVIYLLGIGRFYTANAESSTSTVSTQQQSSAAMRSFLSTTLTSQLNSAISSVLGNDSHWSFGTNVATGTYGWNNMEVDGLLQGRLLNERLLINGNFGYRDRPTYTSNFVGDFDIRYLLTPRGSVSLRAYSETNDRYFTKSSLTTQGIGLTLKRDFNTFRDLFWWRKNKGKKGKATP